MSGTPIYDDLCLQRTPLGQVFRYRPVQREEHDDDE